MRQRFLCAATLLFLAACTSHGSSTSNPGGPPISATPTPANPIEHIVFIVQENRTLDNIFGGPNGFPGADTVGSGQTSTGQSVALTQVNLEKPVFSGGDPNNYHFQWLTACNAPSPQPWPVGQTAPCRMNGFNLNAQQQKGFPKPVSVGTIYSYVNRSEVAPYWFIAQHYALGDEFFMGHNSESYTAHQYIFSSQSHGTVDAPVYPSSFNCGLLYEECVYVPWGCDSPAGTLMYTIDSTTGAYNGPPSPPPSNAPAPCFGQSGNYPSIADRAQAANLSWRVYAYSMCSNILGLDVNFTIRYTDKVWPDSAQMANCHTNYGIVNPLKANSAHFVAPSSQFLSDESSSSSSATKLAAITWILPGPLTSDHPGVPFGDCGPGWVSKVINAIGSNANDWKSTVIFVLWDDWGGFYDHKAPYVVRDQVGPGFRVPLLVISPYVRAGQVVHTNIEFATLNKFVETTFGLPSLGATDATPYLNNLDAFFNFSQTPLSFTPIPYTNYFHCRSLPAAQPHYRKGAEPRWLRIDGDD
jgi:phospholipase C